MSEAMMNESRGEDMDEDEDRMDREREREELMICKHWFLVPTFANIVKKHKPSQIQTGWACNTYK